MHRLSCRLMLLAVAVCVTGAHPVVLTEAHAAKPKPWRLIVNDDGEIPPPNANRTVEDTLTDRFNATRGTQVDAYFLCIASTDRVVAPPAARPQDAMSQWAKYGDVPEHVDQMIRRYIAEAHKEGMDIILAARLNDIHDAWAPTLTYPLKVERPDLLLGEKKNWPSDALMQAHWSGFNWAEPEVRQHFLDFLVWACERWGFDGVELDWFRHPLFFRFGEEAANTENITQFVRDVRAALKRIGRKRRRPYLLTTRPPDTPELALRSGFDVEQWLEEGLLDMLMIGGGYMPYGGRLKNFVDMAHRYRVHAYPCQNHYHDPEKMRSYASGFWALGADGFYMFNYGGVDVNSERGSCLNQLGSTATLAGLDKRFVADSGCSIRYIGYTNPPSQFPTSLVGGDPVELVVGDNLARDRRSAAKPRLTLQITVSNMNNLTDLADLVAEVTSDEDIAVRINGRRVAQDAIRRLDADTFLADVDGTAFVDGINQVDVRPGPKSVGSLAANVNGVELIADYPPYTPTPDSPAPANLRDNTIHIAPASTLPLSMFGTPVGTSRSVKFNSPHDPASIKQVTLALVAHDFDAPEELAISFNGVPLPVPDGLLCPTGDRAGKIDVPKGCLRKGANEVAFTFASNLNGATSGFDVKDALLVLTPE